MIIGIDLGTSTSEVAFVEKSGRVVVIPNREGELITPSVVHIKKNGRALVGNEAREYLFTRPECTFMEVKRKFGTDERFMAHGKLYAPEEIQAHIISYLVDCAEEYTGEDVTGAVITVPAYFTDVQRKQTVRAGTLAGVSVERVINEPTSAALDYGLNNLIECEHVLVYDFGGGTLDVTVLELFEGVVDVKSSCGNNRLGGKDFDEILMKFIAGEHNKSIMSDPRAEMKLKQAATNCKVTLSDVLSAEARLPLILGDLSIDRTVSRTKFEELIRPLISSTGEQIDTALSDAGLNVSDLQKILLVGGTTRVPLVRRYVAEKLGVPLSAVDAPANSDSPELMVVRGAAIQAAIIEGVISEEKSVVLTDVCPYTLGMRVVTQNGFIVDPLIKKNVTIPYEYSKVYSALFEYQRAMEVEIYQGESEYSQENTQIGQLLLDELPRKRDELARAEVTFAYDVNGLLSVKARSLGNDKTAATVIDINSNNLPSRPPVKLVDWERAKGAAKYRPLLRKVLKIMDEFMGTDFFVERKLFVILDMCNEMKYALIQENESIVEGLAQEIKTFVEDWEKFMSLHAKE